MLQEQLSPHRISESCSQDVCSAPEWFSTRDGLAEDAARRANSGCGSCERTARRAGRQCQLILDSRQGVRNPSPS